MVPDRRELLGVSDKRPVDPGPNTLMDFRELLDLDVFIIHDLKQRGKGHVETVAQWVPKEIMNELESLIETEAINIDDNAVCSILSCWLVFLRIVDAAASKDNMNRLALTSYVSKCRTVDKIFDLIVLYGNIGGDRKVKLDDILDLHEILRDNSISKIS